MTATSYIDEYNAFMKWFKASHPEMYGKYWTTIVIPLDDSGVGANDIKIDDQSFERIVDL